MSDILKTAELQKGLLEEFQKYNQLVQTEPNNERNRNAICKFINNNPHALTAALTDVANGYNSQIEQTFSEHEFNRLVKPYRNLLNPGNPDQGLIGMLMREPQLFEKLLLKDEVKESLRSYLQVESQPQSGTFGHSVKNYLSDYFNSDEGFTPFGMAIGQLVFDSGLDYDTQADRERIAKEQMLSNLTMRLIDKYKQVSEAINSQGEYNNDDLRLILRIADDPNCDLAVYMQNISQEEYGMAYSLAIKPDGKPDYSNPAFEDYDHIRTFWTAKIPTLRNKVSGMQQ